MPPTLATLLIGGMTDGEFHEAVLGDFTEEWHQRASAEGPDAANWWFWRQTVRSLPHLARMWWRAARVRDVVASLGGVGAAYLTIFVTSRVVEMLGTRLLAGVGVPRGALPIRIAETVGTIALLSVAGGVAARLAPRAPLVSTAGFALSLFAAMTFAVLTTPQVPEAYVIVLAALPAIGVGGVTALRMTRKPPVDADREHRPP